MKEGITRFSVTLGLVLATLGGAVAVQPTSVAAATLAGGSGRTDSRIAYHGGPVMTGTPGVYFVWYGCWGQTGCGGTAAPSNDTATMDLMATFASEVGGSPYFQINAGYPGAYSHPSGALLYGGSVIDRYSRGKTLTAADVGTIAADQITSNGLPQDPGGIYVVLTSSDVTVVDGATEFCVTCCDFHGTATALGSQFSFAFVGNPARCPNGCASQFNNGVPSPNANFAADAMAAWLAHVLSGVVTNPFGGGWFDRYGLENSEKCEGTFGATEHVMNPNGQLAEANIRLGGRSYLLQQNWVNDKKGRCAMSTAQ